MSTKSVILGLSYASLVAITNVSLNAASGCGVLTDFEISYLSKTGSGSLHGSSGFRPNGNSQDISDPTAPWNSGPILKWKRRVIDHWFYREEWYWNCTGSGAGIDYSNCYAWEEHAGSGYLTWDYGWPYVLTNHWEMFSTGTSPVWGCESTPETWSNPIYHGLTSLANGNPDTVDSPDCDTSPGWTFFTWQRTLTTQTISVCEDRCFGPTVGGFYRVAYGSGYEYLDEPDTIEAAIERNGGVVTGAFRRTYTGGMGTTYPESKEPISFTSGRTVTVTLENICDDTYMIVANLLVGEFDGYDANGEASFMNDQFAIEKNVIIEEAVESEDGRLSFQIPVRVNRVIELDQSSLRILSVTQSRSLGSQGSCSLNTGGGVNFTLPLGAAEAGLNAGALSLTTTDITPEIFTPQS